MGARLLFFLYVLTNVSEHKRFGGHKKFRDAAPECPLVATGLCSSMVSDLNTKQEPCGKLAPTLNEVRFS